MWLVLRDFVDACVRCCAGALSDGPAACARSCVCVQEELGGAGAGSVIAALAECHAAAAVMSALSAKFKAAVEEEEGLVRVQRSMARAGFAQHARVSEHASPGRPPAADSQAEAATGCEQVYHELRASAAATVARAAADMERVMSAAVFAAGANCSSRPPPAPPRPAPPRPTPPRGEHLLQRR